MTTSVKVHVNGRYRATVIHKNATGGIISKTIVHGNYEGSPNSSGEETFHLQHPAHGIFEVTEAQVHEDPKARVDSTEPKPEPKPDPGPDPKPAGSVLGI